ncbi:MAG: response regulator [Salinimicrobium sp.]
MKMDIVIVDDDAVVLFLHKILVNKTLHSGCSHEFDNAERALEFILERKDTQQPLLVLLDINMPCMTGWQFLEVLQEKISAKNVFVVMVTSSVNSSDKKKAEQYPLVVEYLEKPLSRQSCSGLCDRLNRLS